jgi:hypothetical protein
MPLPCVAPTLPGRWTRFWVCDRLRQALGGRNTVRLWGRASARLERTLPVRARAVVPFLSSGRGFRTPARPTSLAGPHCWADGRRADFSPPLGAGLQPGQARRMERRALARLWIAGLQSGPGGQSPDSETRIPCPGPRPPSPSPVNRGGGLGGRTSVRLWGPGFSPAKLVAWSAGPWPGCGSPDFSPALVASRPIPRPGSRTPAPAPLPPPP